MSEVGISGTFVDEKSFKDFNTSFDTDDPLISGDFENDYISSIEEITNFMNNTSCTEGEPKNEVTTHTTPPPVRLLTKSSDNIGDKSPPEDKDKGNRKNKSYAPVYSVRERVAGTNPAPAEANKKREPKPSAREKRIPKENGHTRAMEPKERAQPRQIAKRDDEPVVEIKKKDEESREAIEYQQRKMEEMRRVHDQEQQERDRRLREKEKERLDRDKLQASRIPGERATIYDLMTVQFNDGVSLLLFLYYPSILLSLIESTIPTTHLRYPGPGGGNMFKDLPPAYIGKLLTHFNKDLVMPQDEDGDRNIGDKPLGKDLNNAVFSPTSKFTPHQMVLVPRSKGGFTYGRIVKECTFACRIDESVKHEIAAWRVLVSGTGDDTSGTPKVRKDVLAGNIGKLYIPEQLQAAMQAASEAASLPTPATNASATARRRISPEARDSFPVNTMPTQTSAPYLPSAVAPVLNYAQALQANASTPASPTASAQPIAPLAADSSTGDNVASAVVDGRVSPPADPLARKAEDSNNESSGTQKPLRGVLELPEGVFAKAQKDIHHKLKRLFFTCFYLFDYLVRHHKPRFNRSHENSHENLGGFAAEGTPAKKLLVVIDGPNVAMKHGNKTFSVKGISIAAQHYKSRGFDVVAFVPEYFATRKAPQHQLGSSTLKLGDFMNSVSHDDMPMLNALVDQGLIVLTPPQDYDDSYSIEYARKHNCCIVTNDRYNDNREKAQTRKFIRDHSISFTFVRDEFMPNPDFKFPNS